MIITIILTIILLYAIYLTRSENKELKDELEFKERQLKETEIAWQQTIKDFRTFEQVNQKVKEDYLQQLDEVWRNKEKQQEQESFYATLNGSPAYLQKVMFDLEDHMLAIIQNEGYKDYVVEKAPETAENVLHHLTTLRSYMALSSKMFNSKIKVRNNEQKDTNQSFIRTSSDGATEQPTLRAVEG